MLTYIPCSEEHKLAGEIKIRKYDKALNGNLNQRTCSNKQERVISSSFNVYGVKCNKKHKAG